MSTRHCPSTKLNFFKEILERLGCGAQQALALAHLSSMDFCLSTAPQRPSCIPLRMWHQLIDHYRLSGHCPYFLLDHRDPISSVFIPKKLTKQLVADGVIAEKIHCVQRLYQFLNWTLRINQMPQTVAIFQGRNGRRVLLIDVELHDQSGSRLYALCTPNDVRADHIEKWQLVGLLTASKLADELDLDPQDLPRGVRAMSPKFDQLRSTSLSQMRRRILAVIRQRDGQRTRNRYLQIKCVATGKVHRGKKRQNAKVLTVSVTEIGDAVRNALADERCSLIPIVSIDSAKQQKRTRKCGFSVDHILLIRLKGECVGVVFRDGEPVISLLDCYDITNKALLCDPSFDVDSLNWFKSDHDKLRILTDSDYECLWNRTLSPSPTPPSMNHVLSSFSSSSSSPRMTPPAPPQTVYSHPMTTMSPNQFMAVPVVINDVGALFGGIDQIINVHIEWAFYFQQFVPSQRPIWPLPISVPRSQPIAFSFSL